MEEADMEVAMEAVVVGVMVEGDMEVMGEAAAVVGEEEWGAQCHSNKWNRS